MRGRIIVTFERYILVEYENVREEIRKEISWG